MFEALNKLYGDLDEAVVATQNDKLIYFNKAAEDMGITSESRLCDITPIEIDSSAGAEDIAMSDGSIQDDDVHVLFLTEQTESEPSLPSQAVLSLLSSIKGHLSVLKMSMDLLLPVNWTEYVDTNPKQNQKYYSMLYHSYYGLIRVLENITDVYSEFGEQFKSEYTSFDVVQTMYELLNTVSILMGEDGPELCFHSDCSWLDTMANRARLEQAVLNLLSNAIKYAGNDGKVTLHVRKMNHNLIISVTDTGPGPKAYTNTLWKTYSQGKNMSDEKAGAGFGLALVQKIALAHGGSAFMEPPSEEKGFSVTMSLPIIETDPELCDKAFSPAQDDMLRILTIMADVLPRYNYSAEFLER